MATSTKDWKPTRVRSEDERSGGSSDFLSLSEGENFVGWLLGKADPAEDDPGYYEYLEHWVNDIRKRIPCPGPEVCPLCQDGDRPKTRAKSLWLVESDEKGNTVDPPQLRIFTMNFNLIKWFTEARKEGEKVYGRKFRITLTDDRGNYAVFPKTEKDTLKVTEVKAHLKHKDAPDFEQMLTSQLRKAMEGFTLSRAMESDDEPDEPEEPKGKGAKGKKEEPEAVEMWPDDAEDLIVTVVGADDDGNYFVAEHADYEDTKNIYTTKGIDLDFAKLEEGQIVSFSGALDEDGDYVVSAEPELLSAEQGGDEPDADGDGDMLPAKVSDLVVTVNGECDQDNGTIPVHSDDLDKDFLFYILANMTVDWDDYPQGVQIKITGERDDMGDLCATEIPEVVQAKGAGKKPAASGRKGAATLASKGK